MRTFAFSFITILIIMLFSIVSEATEEDLVLYLSFDEGSGDTVKDLSKNSKEGKIIKAQWTDGKVGKALLFNGKDSYVEVPYNDNFNITDQITLAAWIKPSKFSLSNWHGIINGKKSHYGPYLLQTAVGYAELGLYLGGNWIWLRNATLLTDTEFLHIAATYDEKTGELKIYTNGKLDMGEGTRKKGGPIDSNTEEGIYVGHNYTVDATAWFDGIIDEVAVYKKALTEAEIQKLYKGEVKKRIAAISPKSKLSTTWGIIKSH